MNIDELISQKSNTLIGQKLVQLLTSIWNDKEFILGILADLKNDNDKQKMIDALENGLDDTDTITLLALDIADGLEI